MTDKHNIDELLLLLHIYDMIPTQAKFLCNKLPIMVKK